MKALVVYDSFFGNTEKVAQVIGAALDPQGGAGLVRVADLKPEQLSGLDLLVVGSPTRAFRPSAATSAWLKMLPAGSLKGVRVAAFDTRISNQDANSKVLTFFVKIFGYAAQPIADALIKKGGSLVVSPQGYYVKGSEGPLKDGELERAADWARSIIKV